jgi:hypothetical protein
VGIEGVWLLQVSIRITDFTSGDEKIGMIGLYPVLEVSKWFVGENPSE